MNNLILTQRQNELQSENIKILSINKCSHCGHVGTEVHWHEIYVNSISGYIGNYTCDNELDCSVRWDILHMGPEWTAQKAEEWPQYKQALYAIYEIGMPVESKALPVVAESATTETVKVFNGSTSQFQALLNRLGPGATIGDLAKDACGA